MTSQTVRAKDYEGDLQGKFVQFSSNEDLSEYFDGVIVPDNSAETSGQASNGIKLTSDDQSLNEYIQNLKAPFGDAAVALRVDSDANSLSYGGSRSLWVSADNGARGCIGVELFDLADGPQS